MGRIGIILSMEAGAVGVDKVSNIRVDLGGGDEVTAQMMGDAGSDCLPRVGDYAACMPGPGTGEWYIVALSSSTLPRMSESGERRTVATGPTGAVVSTITQKSDGSVRMENDAGWAELAATGIVEINGNFKVLP